MVAPHQAAGWVYLKKRNESAYSMDSELNKEALFTDETEDYRIPAEPDGQILPAGAGGSGRAFSG